MKMFRELFQTDPSPSSQTRIEDIDEEIKLLQVRLEEKRKIAIEKMGSKWLLHPDHYVQNQNKDANSLGFKSV